MQEIILLATGWTTREDFYTAYLAAVGAPDWLDKLAFDARARGVIVDLVRD